MDVRETLEIQDQRGIRHDEQGDIRLLGNVFEGCLVVVCVGITLLEIII